MTKNVIHQAFQYSVYLKKKKGLSLNYLLAKIILIDIVFKKQSPKTKLKTSGFKCHQYCSLCNRLATKCTFWEILKELAAIYWQDRASQVAIGGKEPTCQCRKHKRHGFDPWFGKIPWRREWQPTPVFLTGESHGQRSMANYSPQGRKESDMIEATQHAYLQDKDSRISTQKRLVTPQGSWELTFQNILQLTRGSESQVKFLEGGYLEILSC